MSCPSMPMSHYSAMFEGASAQLQPVTAHLELTRRCHLDCTICYQAEQTQDEAELLTEEWRAVFAELRALGTFFITLSGGELFLRKDALELAHLARTLGFSLRLATTGTLLDEARCDAIAALFPQQVEVTLFSLDPRQHDGVTRSPGSLSRTLQGVRRLRSRGVPVLLKTPLVRAAWRDWPEIAALARSLGASHNVDPTLTSRDDGDPTPFSDRLSEEELAEFYAHPLVPAELRAAAAPDDETCKVGRHFLVIGPTGDILPCVSLPVVLGNVRRDRLGEVWRSHAFLRELRAITTSRLPTCSGCAKSGYCGRCPGMALLEDGDLYGPSAFACMTAAAKERAATGHVRPGPPGGRRLRLRVVA